MKLFWKKGFSKKTTHNNSWSYSDLCQTSSILLYVDDMTSAFSQQQQAKLLALLSRTSPNLSTCEN